MLMHPVIVQVPLVSAKSLKYIECRPSLDQRQSTESLSQLWTAVTTRMEIPLPLPAEPNSINHHSYIGKLATYPYSNRPTHQP
jgi:hypothetical protein